VPLGPNEHVTVAVTVIINGEPITIVRIEPMPPKAKFTICVKVPTGAPPPNDTTCVYFPYAQDHDDGGVHVSHEVWVNSPGGGAPDNYIVVARSCNANGVCEGNKTSFPPGSILIPDPPQPAGLTMFADRFPTDPQTEAAVLAALGMPNNPWTEVWTLTTGDMYFSINNNPPAPPVHVGAAFRPGDMNCDNVLNPSDIDLFVQAMIDPAAFNQAHPECGYFYADVNGDGKLNGLDVGPFVRLLTD
jgi:hypothetical protein